MRQLVCSSASSGLCRRSWIVWLVGPLAVVALALALASTAGALAADIEAGFDRPGGDLTKKEMRIPAGGQPSNPKDPTWQPIFSRSCKQACEGDQRCVAWTLVKAGVQGPHAICYLKDSVPPKTANACCTSGTIVRAANAIEANTDRPGHDLRQTSAADPAQCKGACDGEPACVAWTWVKAGWQGPAPRCYLKKVVPKAVPATCCTSGIKGGG
jgi:hypothetical protein